MPQDEIKELSPALFAHPTDGAEALDLLPKNPTREQVQAVLDKLALEVRDIRAQLDARCTLGAEPVDEAWRYRARKALSYRQQSYQRALVIFGQINRAERRAANAASQSRREHLFIEQARRELDRATWLKLWAGVDAEMKAHPTEGR